MAFERISIDQALQLIQSENVNLFDIRDPDSFAAGHIENAIHVGNHNVESVVASASKQQPVIIYCYHGNSSQGAADYFSSLGFERCFSVDGGYEEWKFRR